MDTALAVDSALIACEIHIVDSALAHFFSSQRRNSRKNHLFEELGYLSQANTDLYFDKVQDPGSFVKNPIKT